MSDYYKLLIMPTSDVTILEVAVKFFFCHYRTFKYIHKKLLTTKYVRASSNGQKYFADMFAKIFCTLRKSFNVCLNNSI